MTVVGFFVLQSERIVQYFSPAAQRQGYELKEKPIYGGKIDTFSFSCDTNLLDLSEFFLYELFLFAYFIINDQLYGGEKPAPGV